MAIKTMTLTENQKPTKKQLAEIEQASKMPITFDDDSPEFTEEQLRQFKRVNEELSTQKKENRKQNVTLRLSPQTVKKAKSLGKGYTSILAAIIEKALNDPDGVMIK